MAKAKGGIEKEVSAFIPEQEFFSEEQKKAVEATGNPAEQVNQVVEPQRDIVGEKVEKLTADIEVSEKESKRLQKGRGGPKAIAIVTDEIGIQMVKEMVEEKGFESGDVLVAIPKMENRAEIKSKIKSEVKNVIEVESKTGIENAITKATDTAISKGYNQIWYAIPVDVADENPKKYAADIFEKLAGKIKAKTGITVYNPYTTVTKESILQKVNTSS